MCNMYCFYRMISVYSDNVQKQKVYKFTVCIRIFNIRSSRDVYQKTLVLSLNIYFENNSNSLCVVSIKKLFVCIIYIYDDGRANYPVI